MIANQRRDDRGQNRSLAAYWRLAVYRILAIGRRLPAAGDRLSFERR
jgi:hypothetical protein